MGFTHDDDKGSPADKAAERLLDALERLSPEDLQARGFDAAKVERIRAQIRAGTFSVDPEAVAAALLAKLGGG